MILTERGAKTYQGRACKYGHEVRYASNHNCVECNRTQLYVTDRERRLERMRRNHAANRAHRLEQMKRYDARRRLLRIDQQEIST